MIAVCVGLSLLFIGYRMHDYYIEERRTAGQELIRRAIAGGPSADVIAWENARAQQLEDDKGNAAVMVVLGLVVTLIAGATLVAKSETWRRL